MNIPNKCPSCRGKLLVTDLCCPDCKSTIKGNFELPIFARLEPEEEGFLKVFLSARGSIKEVERRLGISYPTVKGRLEALLNKLGLGAEKSWEKPSRLGVIERLERGEISPQEAAELLRSLEA